MSEIDKLIKTLEEGMEAIEFLQKHLKYCPLCQRDYVLFLVKKGKLKMDKK